MRHDTLDRIEAKDAYELHLSELYGPKPINIFKRLRNHLDLSHAELAARMFTSKQALVRLEQGTYESPLPVALDFWTRDSGIAGITELSLTHQYEAFQEKMRERHEDYFGSNSELETFLRSCYFLLSADSPHPLVHLRKPNERRNFGVSVTEVSKALCLPQATLQHWETKWRLQKTVPRGFQQVLLQIGYTKLSIKEFCDYYVTWRNVRLGR